MLKWPVSSEDESVTFKFTWVIVRCTSHFSYTAGIISVRLYFPGDKFDFKFSTEEALLILWKHSKVLQG